MTPSAPTQPPTPPALYLLDTNILARLTEAKGPHYRQARRAVEELTKSGATLCIAPQILIEFWSLATRPRSENGLALPTATARAELAKHEGAFVLLPDRPEIFAQWKALVSSFGVIGRDVHDTRIAAAALVYNIPHVLTFNGKHFLPFTPTGLIIVDPANVPTYTPPAGAPTP